LVLEEFIKPSIWRIYNDTSVIDQWTWCERARNSTFGVQALQNHWDTWVTEDDMRSLHHYGITHLRIPIGYWTLMNETELALHNEPFITGEWDYLVRAIKWSKNFNMSVIIDLHAAPGSQNPWQHSGRAYQSNWGRNNTVNRTLDIIDRIAKRVKDFESDPTTNGTVVGIAVLNEPFPASLVDGGFPILRDYYQKAYHVIRKYLNHDYMVVIDGAFTWDAWNGFMPKPEYQNVVLDLHRYQCFDPYLNAAPLELHWNITCFDDTHLPNGVSLPVFYGEWSLGYKVPADSAWNEPFPDHEQKIFLKKWALAQMNTYEHNGLGWFFWNFKTESAAMWNYMLGVNNGFLPCNLPAKRDVENGCRKYDATVALYSC